MTGAHSSFAYQAGAGAMAIAEGNVEKMSKSVRFWQVQEEQRFSSSA
jgi:hypothetical protein